MATIERDPQLDAIVLKHARPNCAQCSFLAMREVLDLDVDVAGFERALTAYPGIGQTGETCGAVTGPLLAIGLALGPDDPTDMEQSMKAGAAAHRFVSTVEQEFGSTRCGDIIESFYGKRIEMTDPEQVKGYADAGGMEHCVNVVQTAVHIARDIVEESAGKEREL